MNGNFLGIGMDLATNASVQVEQSQPYGILITNGEFTAFCDTAHSFCQAPGNNRSPRHVLVGPANKGAVKFVNSAFWGPAASELLIQLNKTTERLKTCTLCATS